MIEAAGGVLWRRSAKGRVKVLVVHRPRYDDWTFPKGKLDPGEEALEAALREVQEETGLHCRAGEALPETRYVDRRGREKRVRYWAMEVIDGTFHPNEEVDEIRWVDLDAAVRLLTYERDEQLVDQIRALALRAA